VDVRIGGGTDPPPYTSDTTDPGRDRRCG
jgi:hypothetical protein